MGPPAGWGEMVGANVVSCVVAAVAVDASAGEGRRCRRVSVVDRIGSGRGRRESSRGIARRRRRFRNRRGRGQRGRRDQPEILW